MYNGEKDLFERHLKEMKAKSKTKSFNALVKRMRAEQDFRRILDELSEKIHSQEILPFLTSRREEIGYPPDFVVWKDEFRIPVFLVEADDTGEYTIFRKKIEDFLRYLKRTDLTEAIIVWMYSPEFPSITLRIEEIETRVNTTDELFVFTSLKSFKNVVLETIGKKETVWPVPKLEAMPKIMEPESLLKTLDSLFKKTFQKEMTRRRPRISEKREALESITDKNLEQTCLIITNYIKGELSLEDFSRSFRSIVGTTRKSSSGVQQP